MTTPIKKQAILLGILLCLSILSYTKLGETIALIAAISMIGLPITLFLFALPTIAAAIAILLITQAAGRLAGISFGWIFGATICIGFYHLPEYILRPAAKAEAEAMLAQDTGWDGAFGERHVALLGTRRIGDCSTRCRELLAAGAEEVFITDQIEDYWQLDQLSGNVGGLSFFMPAQGQCDPVLDELRRAHSGVMVSRFDRDECYQARPANLNEMDIAIWNGRIGRPAGTRWVENLHRSRLFRRDTTGWQLAEQSSQASFRLVIHAMLTHWGGYGMEIKFDPGFYWKRATIGERPETPFFKAGS